MEYIQVELPKTRDSYILQNQKGEFEEVDVPKSMSFVKVKLFGETDEQRNQALKQFIINNQLRGIEDSINIKNGA